MNHAHELAESAIDGGAHHRVRPEPSQWIRKLFAVLQAAYGTTFLAKFATGELNDAGEDKGVRTALLVWESDLIAFAPDVIEAAVARCREESPKFPPNLPELVQACKAITPRKSYYEEIGNLALPMDRPVVRPVEFERKGDGKDWARALQARHDAGQHLTLFQIASYRACLRLDTVGAGS